MNRALFYASLGPALLLAGVVLAQSLHDPRLVDCYRCAGVKTVHADDAPKAGCLLYWVDGRTWQLSCAEPLPDSVVVNFKTRKVR